MSAPHTNIERQKRNHRWGLIATVGALVVAVVMGAVVFLGATEDPGAPMQPTDKPATE